jgi:anti-sigma regulatory factor (Ser/Thr protein kinase)
VRRFVRAALEEVEPELRARAELVVSELATNALRHGAGDLGVDVLVERGRVRIEVADASPALPRPRRPGPEDPGGRGMLVVDALAQAWGVEPGGEARGGKVVWVTLAPDGDGTRTTGPARGRGDVPEG